MKRYFAHILLVPFLPLFFGACSIKDLRKATNNRVNVKTKIEYNKWDRAKVYTGCNNEEVEAGLNCGLLVDGIKDQLSEYHKTQCKGLKATVCNANFDEMIKARFLLRYPVADYETLALECKGYPETCDSYEKLEMKLLRSHNAGIDQLAQAKREYEAKRLAQEQAESRREILQGITAATYVMSETLKAQPKSMNCTSNKIGNTTYTNCH